MMCVTGINDWSLDDSQQAETQSDENIESSAWIFSAILSLLINT